MAVKKVDPESTRHLLSTFNTAAEDVRSFHTKSENIRSETAWTGNAGTAFSEGITDWQRGLKRVSDALGKLNDDMAYYSSVTGQAEDEIQQTMLRAAPVADASWAN